MKRPIDHYNEFCTYKNKSTFIHCIHLAIVADCMFTTQCILHCVSAIADEIYVIENVDTDIISITAHVIDTMLEYTTYRGIHEWTAMEGLLDDLNASAEANNMLQYTYMLPLYTAIRHIARFMLHIGYVSDLYLPGASSINARHVHDNIMTLKSAFEVMAHTICMMRKHDDGDYAYTYIYTCMDGYRRNNTTIDDTSNSDAAIQIAVDFAMGRDIIYDISVWDIASLYNMCIDMQSENKWRDPYYSSILEYVYCTDGPLDRILYAHDILSSKH